jgi:hypothetical protein
LPAVARRYGALLAFRFAFNLNGAFAGFHSHPAVCFRAGKEVVAFPAFPVACGKAPQLNPTPGFSDKKGASIENSVLARNTTAQAMQIVLSAAS